jgi:hypothetical protein
MDKPLMMMTDHLRTKTAGRTDSLSASAAAAAARYRRRRPKLLGSIRLQCFGRGPDFAARTAEYLLNKLRPPSAPRPPTEDPAAQALALLQNKALP